MFENDLDSESAWLEKLEKNNDKWVNREDELLKKIDRLYLVIYCLLIIIIGEWAGWPG